MKKVQIYCADVRALSENKETYLTQIAPCYIQKYKSAARESDAVHELAAGILLQQHLGVRRDEQLAYNAYQKPLLVSQEKCFNLSHSGDLAVLAVSDCEIGIDVEQIQEFHEAAAQKIFSSRQIQYLSQLEPEQKNAWYIRFWTEYEAMLKLKGTGFPDRWIKGAEPAENCHIQTIRYRDYFITWATEEPVTYQISEQVL